jgi:hypothetical protein
MSKIEVNEIDAQCGSTVTVGSAGKTVAVPGNVVKTNAVQASDGGNIVNQCGTTITLGASGDTITLAAGASQSGFGRAGSVDWQTGDIKTATFTASDGEGYFCNTTSSAFTVNLPAGSAGAIVAINDYASTAATNNITIAANGSEKIQGSTTDHVINTNGVTITLVYVDSTQGWKLVDTGEASSLPEQALFTVATGGTITCCGDYKIHTFTGPGTFCVSQIGNGPTNPNGGPTTVSYMVVAGGGGQTNIGHYNGGGGAGGFREGRDIAPSYTASPLVAPGLTITASPFPIGVGAGGSGGPGPSGCGSNSVFSTITSTGGGGGGSPALGGGQTGGSGGGGSTFTPGSDRPGSAGNTPPVSPPQGNPGGIGKLSSPPGTAGSGGGGGATAAGGNSNTSTPITAGDGGAGATTSISGSSTTYAGGGGGSAYLSGAGGSGGSGGGGNGGQYPNNPAATNGATNTGGGAGGDAGFTNPTGGSGIVIIRYKYQ